MALVTLRSVARADAAELIRDYLASRKHHRPWVAPFTDAAGFDAWFGRALTGPSVRLVAREPVSGGIVGVVNLIHILFNPFARSATLTYNGMATFAGRGLMTEAVGLATAYAFEAFGLHRLEANINPGNARSLALVRRLGFRREGFSPRHTHGAGGWHDLERWALRADERKVGDSCVPRPWSPCGRLPVPTPAS